MHVHPRIFMSAHVQSMYRSFASLPLITCCTRYYQHPSLHTPLPLHTHMHPPQYTAAVPVSLVRRLPPSAKTLQPCLAPPVGNGRLLKHWGLRRGYAYFFRLSPETSRSNGFFSACRAHDGPMQANGRCIERWQVASFAGDSIIYQYKYGASHRRQTRIG